MKLSLSAAAREAGKSKSTISRAIKEGRLSAHPTEKGSYEIEPSELFRAFPRTPSQPVVSNSAQPPAEPPEGLHFLLETIEKERKRERDQMQATIDDLRSRLDRSEDRVTALLSAPKKPKKWWIW